MPTSRSRIFESHASNSFQKQYIYIYIYIHMIIRVSCIDYVRMYIHVDIDSAIGIDIATDVDIDIDTWTPKVCKATAQSHKHSPKGNYFTYCWGPGIDLVVIQAATLRSPAEDGLIRKFAGDLLE